MRNRGRSSARVRTAGAQRVVALALLLALSVAAPRAGADPHDPEEAGNPVRIAAYLLHPVGVALDWLIFRPAHWLVNREPFRTIFGHED
jgi:hypothetical protein